MKLTAKLAYSQIKNSKTRTLWTIVGIILSTALITAVCSFAASGNALIIEFLGTDYGEYRGLLKSTLVIPVAILCLIIVSMSVVVISNSIRASAMERRSQFGMLKSVGATKKQIISTVMYESIFLSIIGIPIGILLGLFLASLGIKVGNGLLEELNSLVEVAMTEFSINIEFVVSWEAILIAIFISFITVSLSAWLPARKAAETTAIDSIRGTGVIKLNTDEIKINPLVERLFGFEGVLAAKNMKRSKKNLRSSIISITVGVILFINLYSISTQAGQMEDILYPKNDSNVIVDYASIMDNVENKNTGREESVIVAPINSKDTEAITEKLREYEDVDIIAIGYDMETYDLVVSKGMLTDEMVKALDIEEERKDELSAEIVTVDLKNYEKLCEKANVPVGSNILLNYYDYNDYGEKKSIKPFNLEKGEAGLIKADESITNFKVDGVLTKEDIPKEFFGLGTNTFRLIVPKGEMRGYSWFANPKDIKGFIAYANDIIDEVYPDAKDLEYNELGYTTRVFKIDDYVKVMNIGIIIATIFVYSFVILLLLIGFTNVISTISTNVQIRFKEFAVLQSVGMTLEGLLRMINLESIMISIKSLIIGLPVGLILTYLVNLPIRKIFPIPYKIPWLAIVISIVLVFFITAIIMGLSIKKIKKKNIIEMIRSGN